MNRYFIRQGKVMAITLMAVITTAGLSPEAQAGSGGAFLGGMVAGHVVTNMSQRDERRTRAQEEMAYNSQPRAAAQPAAAPASSGSSSQSVEDKLNQLDKLAAGGYITKAEYNRRRQAILDSM